MADWLNVVSDYGADNTGAADATADISKALKAAKAPFGGIQRSAVVYLPPGVYLISAPLLVPPGVTLLGATPMNQSGDGQTQDWGSDSSTVLSYGVHGHANGQFLYDGMVSVFESSQL
jgi:hypothetical protein